MKKTKRILSLVLVMLLVLSSFAFSASAVAYDDELEVDWWIDVTIGKEDVAYKFVPEEDGYYTFRSLSFGDPWAELYDGEGIYMAYSDDYDELSHDFCITEYLYAGETYTLWVGVYLTDDEQWQNISVIVEKAAAPVSAEVVYLPYRTEVVEGYEWESVDPEGVGIEFTMSDGSTYLWCLYDQWNDVNGIPVFFDLGWDDDRCYMEFSCADAVARVYCETIENPVERIEYRGYSIVCYKDLCGYYDYDVNGNEYFYYEWELPELACVDIYYKDGSTEVVSLNSYEYAEYGYVDYYDTQWVNPWGLGENGIIIDYLGVTSYIPVTVEESCVESIEITKDPDTLVYDEYFYPVFDGIEITVTFKDGTSDVVDLEENISSLSYKFGDMGVDLKILTDDYEIYGEYGYDYELGEYYTFTCMGVSCDYTGFEFVDCGWVEEINVEKFSSDGDGMVIEALYDNGTVQTLELYGLVSGSSPTKGYEGYARTDEGIMYYCIEESYDEYDELDGYWVYALGCYGFVSLEDAGVMGDADGDGKVNIKDATAIQKHTAGIIELSETGELFADVDGNGSVNVKDATAIQKHIAGIDTGFDIG